MVRIIVVFICLISWINSSGQELQIQLFKAQGYAASSEPYGFYDNNAGLNIMYKHQLKYFDVLAGLEARSIDWGNQVSLETGLYKKYWEYKKFEIGQSGTASLLIPLFHNRRLVGAGVGTNILCSFNITKKQKLALFSGIHYDIVPQYKRYGPIWNTSEVQFGIQYSRILFSRIKQE